jgi:zinc protease
MSRKPSSIVWLSLAAMLGLTGLARAAEPADGASAVKFDRKTFEIPHAKLVLDNGLTVLVHEDHSVPVVAVNLWYHVGSRNEERGKTGFAHLFEHFFFNGSEHYPFGFREAMDDLGANNRNGTTNTDRTNFFEDVPVSALPKTLFLEADRMGFLAARIDQAMLERERGVVQNEKRQGENQPYGRVFQRIVERIYPGNHPYSWSTIGSMEDLNAATLQDVQRWYGTYYGPNNCVLALAGDITPEQAFKLVKQYFGGIPPGPPLTRPEQWVPRLSGNIREQMQDRVPQARIYRVLHAPAWRDADTQPLQLLASVLSGSRSARLDRRLIYDENIATAVDASLLSNEIAGMLLVTVTVKEGVELARAEAEMDRVLVEAWQKPPTAAELQRAKSRILAGFSRGAERLGGFGGRADILAQSMTLDGQSDGYLRRLQLLASVSPARVREAASRWLQAPHYTMTVTPFPAVQPGATVVDRTVVPTLGDPPEVSFPKVQRAKLSNGLSVMLLERHSTPLVNMTLAVDAGYASDSKERAGLASLALELLDDGTTTRDTFRIADDLDALGAQVVTNSSLDLSLVRLRALSAKLRPSLDVFADVVLRPAFAPDMIEIARRNRLAQIGQEKAQPVTTTQRVVPELLFGSEHAYGKPLTGSGFESGIRAITQDDLRSWYRNWFHPNNATLIVAGDVTLATLLPELERVFAGWQRGQAPAKQIGATKPAQARRVYLIDKPGAPQSVIVATHVSASSGQAEDLAIDTVMRNFGGMATSRLNRNLRLDKHWSYGANGALLDARGPRPLVVTAPVQTDKTRESMLEVLKELRDIAAARPIRGEEFASIMRTQTLGLPGRFATLAALENAALQQLNNGYPDDYFASYARRVRSLSEQDLASAATKFIRPEDVIWVVVGDLAVVERGIRELNFGEIIRLDSDGRAIAGR